MTDRGLPPVDGAPACPFVAFENDRDERATSPDYRHRCYAEARPAPRAIAHQEAYCLSSAFPVCPTFQDWARREAARARGAGVGAQAPAGGALAGAAVAAAGREPVRGTAVPTWPQTPSFADREAGRPAYGADDEIVEDDTEDRGAPAFPMERPQPGTGLAGSRADRVAMGGGATEPPGARPAWPAADDLRAARATGATPPGGSALGGAAFGAAAGAAASGAAGSVPGSAAGSAAGGFAPGRDRAVPDDEFDAADYDDRDREELAYRRRDERIANERGERVEPVEREGGRRGIFGGRDKRPRVGDTRPGRDEDEAASWNRQRVQEPYPAARSRSRMGGLSRVVLAAVALFAAAVGIFLLPSVLPGLLPGASQSSQPPAASSAPSASAGAVAPSESVATGPTPVPTATPFMYTVVPRDTLTKIAKKFGVTVDQILAANPTITNANAIGIGDKIVIPTPAPSGSASTAP